MNVKQIIASSLGSTAKSVGQLVPDKIIVDNTIAEKLA